METRGGGDDNRLYGEHIDWAAERPGEKDRVRYLDVEVTKCQSKNLHLRHSGHDEVVSRNPAFKSGRSLNAKGRRENREKHPQRHAVVPNI